MPHPDPLLSYLDMRNGEAIALNGGCAPPVCRAEEGDFLLARELVQQEINIDVGMHGTHDEARERTGAAMCIRKWECVAEWEAVFFSLPATFSSTRCSESEDRCERMRRVMHSDCLEFVVSIPRVDSNKTLQHGGEKR